jgi:hypothetical protein
MNKFFLFTKRVICIGLIFFLFNPLCSKKNERGSCTLTTGGIGTGQPFVMTTYPFKTEQECRQMGEDRGQSYRASYCPPTGNSNDCYQVYP